MVITTTLIQVIKVVLPSNNLLKMPRQAALAGHLSLTGSPPLDLVNLIVQTFQCPQTVSQPHIGFFKGRPEHSLGSCLVCQDQVVDFAYHCLFFFASPVQSLFREIYILQTFIKQSTIAFID